MTWFAILKMMVILAGALAEWLGRRQGMQAGEAQRIAEQLRTVQDDIAKANSARLAARVGVERDPLRLRDDDGFKRHD